MNLGKPLLVWLTGLSGAGKTTLAKALNRELEVRTIQSTLIDGDEFRQLLSVDLGFSLQDRIKNVERAFNVARLVLQNKTVVICAFITPATSSSYIQSFLQSNDSFEFLEVFCSASLNVCEKRDVKGFYRKARCGAVESFTGVSQQYLKPCATGLVLDTENLSVSECVNSVLRLLKQRGVVY